MDIDTQEPLLLDNYQESVEDSTILQDTYHNHYDILKNYEEIKKSNITRQRITKYELTKCIGMRAEMLAAGAPALIEVPKYVTSVETIARMEYYAKKLPFILRRKVTGRYDYWKISDLETL